MQSFILFTRNFTLSRATLTNEVKTYTDLSTLQVGKSFEQYYATNHFRFGEIIQNILSASNQTITEIKIFNTEGDLLFDSKPDLYLDGRENIAYTTHPPIRGIAKKGTLLDQLQLIDPSYNFTSPQKTELSTIVYPVLEDYNKHQHTIVYSISYDRVYNKLLNDVQNVVILSIVAFVVASFLIIFFVTKFMLKPISQLAKDAQRIEHGDFTHIITVHTRDELEDLAYSVNRMAQSLLQSQQILRNDRDTIEAERNTLSTILGSVADGVIAIDKAHNIVLFNNAASTISGWDAHEVEHKPFESVIMFKDNNEKVSLIDLCNSAQKSPVKLRLSFSARFGDEKIVDLVVSPVPSVYVTELHYIFSFYDVSKEQELEKLKVDFVSIATHELRTPLTALKGYLSVFIDENKQEFNAEQNTFLDRITISVQRLGNLIENLLSVSRIEKGNLALDISQIEWPPFVLQAVDDLKNQATQAKITLTFEQPSQQIPTVSVDTMRIYEVLMNLLGNAISYTPSGGHITVSIEHTDNQVITHIKDTGKGIPTEAIPHLFTKFYRVVGRLEQGSRGTGLGLYISKSIIDLHHGKIWAESEGEGKGSTFSFSLPVVS